VTIPKKRNKKKDAKGERCDFLEKNLLNGMVIDASIHRE